MLNRNGASYKSLKRDRTEEADLKDRFGITGGSVSPLEEVEFDLSDYN